METAEKVTVHRVMFNDRELEKFLEHAYAEGSELISLSVLSRNSKSYYSPETYHYLIVLRQR